MASEAHHGAGTVEMMWRLDGDHHIPTTVGYIPQVSRTILNPSRVSALGDLFFDIEGARYRCEDGRECGLQYLFGVVDTAEVDEAGRGKQQVRSVIEIWIVPDGA
jgi:hypothetical protein